MPKYNYFVNGQSYSINDNEVEEFERDFPSALVSMEFNGNPYKIEVSRKQEALNDGFTYPGVPKPSRLGQAVQNGFKSRQENVQESEPVEEISKADSRKYGVDTLKPVVNVQKERLSKAKESYNANDRLIKDASAYANSQVGNANAENVKEWTKARDQYLSEHTDNAEDILANRVSEGQMIESAQRRQNKAEKLLESADKVEDGQFFRTAGRGMYDALTDQSTYSMGLTDMSDALVLADIQRKIDAGEELTDLENLVLSNKELGEMTESLLAEYMPRGYKAGKVTGEMAPFMAQMALNPAGGVGKAAQKAVLKSQVTKVAANEATKDFAKGVGEVALKEMEKTAEVMARNNIKGNAVRETAKRFGADGVGARIARGAARVGGDALSAAVLTNTLQIGSTALKAKENELGQMYQDVETGEWRYDGMDKADAWRQAELSSFVENFTEMMGEWGMLAPLGKGIGRLGSKIGLDKVGSIIRPLGDKSIANMATKALKKANYDGIFDEWMEEQYGTVLHSILDGEAEISDLWDWDQQIDTLLGVGLFGGFVGSVKAGSYPVQYYKSQNDLRKYDNLARDLDPDWGQKVDAICFASNDELHSIAVSIARDRAKAKSSGNQAEFDKLDAEIKYIASLQNFRGANAAREFLAYTEEEKTIAQNYDKGFEGIDKDVIKRHYDIERGKLMTADPTLAEGLDAGGIQYLDNMFLPEETRAIAIKFLNAKAAYDGMMDGVTTRLGERLDRVTNQLVATDNKGQQVVATMWDGKQAHVVSGDVNINADGKLVDSNGNSIPDNYSVVVRYDNGKKEMVDARLIKDVQKNSTEEVAATLTQDITREELDKAQREIDGIITPEAGQSYTVSDGQNTSEVVVNATDGNVANVTMPDGTTADITVEDLQQGVKTASDAIAVAEDAVATEAEQYVMDAPITRADGIVGTVTSEMDADGRIGVHWNEPVDGKVNGSYTLDELRDMTTRTARMSTTGTEAPVAETPVAEAEEPKEETPTESEYDTFVKEHGEESDVKLDNTLKYIDGKIKKEQKKLDSLKKKKSEMPLAFDEETKKMNDDIDKKIADQQKVVDGITKSREPYTKIDEQRAKARELAESKEKLDKILEDTKLREDAVEFVMDRIKDRDKSALSAYFGKVSGITEVVSVDEIVNAMERDGASKKSIAKVEEQIKSNPNGLRGFYEPSTGKIYVVSNNVYNYDTGLGTVTHEGWHEYDLTTKAHEVLMDSMSLEDMRAVMDKLNKGGKDKNGNYRAGEFYQHLDAEETADEIVAHAMEMVFNYRQANPSLTTREILTKFGKIENETVLSTIEKLENERNRGNVESERNEVQNADTTESVQSDDRGNEEESREVGQEGVRPSGNGEEPVRRPNRGTGKSRRVNGKKETLADRRKSARMSVSSFDSSSDKTEDLFAKAVEEFGTTDNFKVAGYMLPDGKLLDFGDGGNTRGEDHRSIGRVYDSTPSERYMYIDDFLSRGAVRMSPEGPGFEIANKPTKEQRARLGEFIRKNDGTVNVDFWKDGNNTGVKSAYYENAKEQRILNDLDRFYDDGIIPQGNARFSIVISNSDPFYSNATKALEGIRQNKATAQQWIAMLQKNGGLKAEEDKWLGLSDWLNGQEGSIAKADVEKYVAENGNVIHAENGEFNEMNDFIGKPLSDIVGKELANDILAVTDDKEFNGDSLRIGGEGMRGFYDDILPRFMDKYGKKWGVKTGTMSLPSLQNEDGWHYVDVTPEMKESVMQGQPMFSIVTPEQDAEYRKAYESGDTEKASQMVRDAFKAKFPNTKVVDENGEPLVMYHGTNQNFNEFKKRNSKRWVVGLEINTEAQGFFFSDNEAEAEEYGNNVKSVFLVANNIADLSDHDGNLYEDLTGYNPWDYAGGADSWWDILDNSYFSNGKTEETGTDTVRRAKELGYDAIKFRESSVYDDKKVTSIAVFEPNQIKSAEPFTFDDNRELIPLSERFNDENNDTRFSVSDDNKLGQTFGSAGTSLNQIPAGFRKIKWNSGTVNLDLGGGKFDTATNYLESLGVENLVFDPYNRSSEHNKAIAERIKDNNADTTTNMNVLNVIDSADARANVILQCAKALKDGGTSYFGVYEGDKSGVGRQTKSDSWQNNRTLKDYVDEVKRYYDDVTIKNGLIVAKNPIITEDTPQSVWNFDYTGDSGIRFSVSEEQDKAYMDAVNSGDIETAQKMVDEVAKRNGYKHHALHGTSFGGYTEFDIDEKGAFFTDNPVIAKEYMNNYYPEDGTPKIYDAYLSIPKPLRYDAKGKKFNDISAKVRELVKKAAENGNGGVIIKNIIDPPSGWSNDKEDMGTDFIVFNPNQIKSAEAVTRDNDGNVIPLSKRFDSGNNDIRFSVSQGSYFSGGDLLGQALKGVIDGKFGVDFDTDIAAVFSNNSNAEIINADVTDPFVKAKVREILDGAELEYFHASPVCHNYSNAKTNAEENELDITTAMATAEFIDEFKPGVVTVENAPRYKNGEAITYITDALDRNSYKYETGVYNAMDFGGSMNRDRFILVAAKDGVLPGVSARKEPVGWYSVVEDLIPSLAEIDLAPWQKERLEKEGIDYTKLEEPMIVYGGSSGSGYTLHALGSQPAPSMNVKAGGARIIMPDGRILECTPRIFARIMGLPDSYKLPEGKTLAYKVIGNGIPVQLTEGVIRPTIEAHDKNPRFSFVGLNGVFNAKTYNNEKLEEQFDKATEMLESGASMKDIKKETGFEIGKDGKWRYEITDGKLNFKNPFSNEDLIHGAIKLRDMWDDANLFKMYPAIGNTIVYAESMEEGDLGYVNGNGSIVLNRDNVMDDDIVTRILVHEIQHKIQESEGFDQGTNSNSKAAKEFSKKLTKKTDEELPELYQSYINDRDGAEDALWALENLFTEDDGSIVIPDDYKEIEYYQGMSDYSKQIIDDVRDGKYKNPIESLKEEVEFNQDMIDEHDSGLGYTHMYYLSKSGEVEARNVEKRFGMTDEQRRNSLAEETEDVSRDMQIVSPEFKKAVKTLEDIGASVNAEKGDVKFSVAYTLNDSQRQQAIKELMEVTGRSKKTVERYLDAENSLAAIMLDGKNDGIFDMEFDDELNAIWNNSDYPQGTVEFSNICRKRLPLTMVYQRLQKEFPNTVFDASTLELMRQIFKEHGDVVACGLCFVEDRRQLLGEIGKAFIDAVGGKELDVVEKESGSEEDTPADKINSKQKAILDKLREQDKYIPQLYELLTMEGSRELREKHRATYDAFRAFNAARGMQAGRLFEAYSEYKREILSYSPSKVKKINDNGGLRIFSFSDFEAHHLIDLVQVITDCAAKGIKIQCYTKVPEFAKAMAMTGAKINRSLIAKGKGYVENEDGTRTLLLDPVEGIDFNDPNFFDSTDNPNVGNILVGISDDHIRVAMLDDMVDYIIPFHSGISKAILKQKGLDEWTNYKLSQLDKILVYDKNGKPKLNNADKHGINIYTDLLDKAEKDGKPIKNKKQFVEAYLKECQNRGWIPRFYQLLNTKSGRPTVVNGRHNYDVIKDILDGKDKFVYTEGYHKLLIDFKLFDKNGKILPQKPVLPIFDNEFNKEILDKYVKDTKEDVGYDEIYGIVKDRLLADGKVKDARLSVVENQARSIRNDFYSKDISSLDGFNEMADAAYRLDTENIALRMMRNGWDTNGAVLEWAKENPYKAMPLVESLLNKNGYPVDYELTPTEIQYLLTPVRNMMDRVEKAILRDDMGEPTPRFSLSSGNLSRFKEDVDEGYFDAMISYKKMQEKIGGKDISDNENAYVAENQAMSKGKVEQEVFDREIMTPLMDFVRSLKSIGISRKMVDQYLKSKHGLERNEYMGMEDEEKRDYSGLTSIYETSDVVEAELAAQDYVDAFESKVDTDELWSLVKKATNYSLDKQYKSGMMSRDRYNEIKKMYEYYVPLRGFENPTAGDEYTYYLAGMPAINLDARAKGRTSESADAIANMGMMATRAIVIGNDNMVKQKMLNLVENHPDNGLVTLKKAWYENVGTKDNPNWKMVTPDIPEDATPDQVADILERFDKDMEEKKKLGVASQNTTGLKLGMFYTQQQGKEHEVIVRRGGRTYVMYINGDPRPAQAINKLNRESVTFFNSVNRFMSGAYTSYNPAFTITNLMRDMGFAMASVVAKEDAEYIKQFSANIGRLAIPKTGWINSAVNSNHVQYNVSKMLRDWKNGTLGDSEVERYFREFIENGSETGFVESLSAEKYISAVKDYMEKDGATTKIKDGFKVVGEAIETLNRGVEDITRFAAYLTSRQMGRSVQRSVDDAKNISVNFNRTGSGAMGAAWFKGTILFFNAATQALNNMTKALKAHPLRATSTFFIAPALLGAAMPFINSALISMFGGDDDDDKYDELSEYDRRNHICLPWIKHNGKYVKIPLPQELRATYGIGDIISKMIKGDYRYGNEEPIWDMVERMTELLPLNPLATRKEEGMIGSVMHELVPDALTPLFESYINSNYRGQKIFQDNKNENAPKFQSAFRSCPKWLVEGARIANSATGGDDVKKGWLDLNPEIAQHLLNQYMGGVAKFLGQAGETMWYTSKSAYEYFKDDKSFVEKWNEYNSPDNIPFVNRVWIDELDEKAVYRVLSSEYYKLKDEMDKASYTEKGYEKRADEGLLDYAERLDDYYKSEDYERYYVLKDYLKYIKKELDNHKEAEDMNNTDAMRETESVIAVYLDQLNRDLQSIKDKRNSE